MKWKLVVLAACLTVIVAFLFIFRNNVTRPYFLSMPYILWTGILMTALLVLLTFIGAKYFSSKE